MSQPSSHYIRINFQMRSFFAYSKGAIIVRVMRWLCKPVHPSWLIAWMSVAVVIGIASSASGIYCRGPSWFAIISILTCLGYVRRWRGAVVVVFIAGLLIGAWRGGIEQAGLEHYKPLYGKAVTVRGAVSDDAAYGPGGDQRLLLKDISINDASLNGQMWTSNDNDIAIKRGDTVTLHGKLEPGFGSVAASMFHASVSRISRPQPGDVGVRVRDWFAGGIRAAIPEPEASLASGYLVGQRSTLPADLDNQLKVDGLTHAVVASGYNLTILVSLGRQAFLGISKYLATVSAFGMIAGFILLSGLSPSMARAGLVASLSLAAWYYGRKIHPFVLLTFAAAITALINPFYIWGDIGWYLSFTSFAGVVILAPLIQHALWRNRERPGVAAQIILDTMSAQAATLPIMILAFGHYSPYALLANLLVLPLVPLAMLLTFVAGTGGLLLPAVAYIFGLPATILLKYMTTVVAHIADWPGAYGDVRLGLPALIVCYLALIGFTVVLWRKTGHDFRAQASGDNAT